MQLLPVFETYRDPQAAENEARVLQKAGITFQLEDESGQLQSLVYPMDVLSSHYKLRINGTDFLRARAALEQYYRNEIHKVQPDYFLYQFTDKELVDVVTKPDEWGPFNKVLALHILEQRGIPIHESVVEGMQTTRFVKVHEPEHFDHYWIILGYACALLGGVLGIVIGWFLKTSKKTLPDGDRVFQFTPQDRRHGKRILLIGIVMFIISICVRVIFPIMLAD
jgi:hypothetical protein